MKITKVDLIFCQPVEDGWRPSFCRIYTDEGIYGDGEVALPYGMAKEAAFNEMKDLAPMLIGMNPLEHEVIWQKLYRNSFFGLNGGPVVFGAISAFDVALWDIKGKYYQAPLWELLGGKERSHLKAYASQLQMGWGVGRRHAASPADYANNTKIALQKGFNAVKINFLTFDGKGKPVARTKQDAFLSQDYLSLAEARIKAVREALGPKGELILENHALTDKLSATEFGNMAKKYGILYYEEPVKPDPNLLSYVHEHTNLNIASGERMYSRWDFAPAFAQNSIQIAQPDICVAGGVTEVKKICDLAYTKEIGVQIHIAGSNLSTAVSLNLEAVLPNFVIHEYNINTCMPKMLSLTKYDYEPKNGYMPIPDRPGIGNEISNKAFETGTVVTIR